ncbi:hypothetical protein GCM10023115_54690 [Pontixanthobacter gangjinensis]|uniref:Phage shock protein B n=1 Tax=Pontixanthobacter gangjinensis TaxID=1028742 RepID=A0A6I4SQ26_9SPHN|nr:hypothetical protein [Pontixanthobacter gangjinensis]MXO57749.1 hypothetical protein [Pontixanthobacter gangjinensis]
MNEQIIMYGTVIIGTVIVAMIALRGWQGWLALKEQELDRRSTPLHQMRQDYELEHGSPVGAARIEIADLKERIRKLEAIASGVDL